MGVISDLSGKSNEELPPVAERSFVEIDGDNFKSMEDFNPDAVAAKIPGVSDLLEARKQLAALVSYMDGKAGAEELIGKILKDPSLLKALSEQKATKKDEPQENA